MAKAQGLRHYAPEASHLFETASKIRDADEAWISTSCRGLQYDAICSYMFHLDQWVDPSYKRAFADNPGS